VEIKTVEAPIKKERVHYLDWLKVFAILMVFIFHNAHFFDFPDWTLKNKTESFGMTIVTILIYIWSMPLFFLLAGAGTKFALKNRTGTQYIKERAKRLLIPFVVGMLLLAPPQGYVENLSKLKFNKSFMSYYPYFFKHLSYNFSLKAFGDNTYHLWFLGFLFVFSIMALPLFIYLKKEIAGKFILKCALFCDNKGFIFLFAIPVLISHLALRVVFPEYNDWADFVYWLIYFIYGYMIFSHEKFKEAIIRHSKASLIIGILCLSYIIALLLLGYDVKWFIYPTYSVESIIYLVIYSLLTWSWVIFILSIGFKFFNFENKFLKYSSEAVLPFYLLHQPIILLIGYFVIQWNLSIIEKFFIISITSFILIIAIYDLLVKRVNFIRFVLGMKELKLSD